MERPAPVAPVRGAGRRVTSAVAVVALAVLVAIAKPWEHAQEAVSTYATVGPGSDVAATAPVVPPSRLPDGVLLTSGQGGIVPLPGGGTLACYDPPAWRLVVDATADGIHTRSAIAVNPVRAQGPLDPAVPVTKVVGGPVSGLGFCSPTGLPGPPNSWTAAVWRISLVRTGGVRASRVALIEPRAGAPGGLATPSPGSAGDWASGRYVLQLQDATDGSREGWIGFDISVVEPP
jgi:hypothetical protein